MDRQAIYDKVKHHLLVAQPRKATSSEGGYEYQNDSGDRCAIGCLIPDDHSSLDDGHPVRSLLHNYPDLKELWGVAEDTDMDFLEFLQNIHDRSPVCDWKKELISVAKLFGLNP